MRVEAYQQVQQIYKTKKVNQAQKAGGTSQKDQLQISSFGKDIQAAKAALADAPDVRTEKIASIKAQMQNGTYRVDNAAFAEKLLKKYEEMR